MALATLGASRAPASPWPLLSAGFVLVAFLAAAAVGYSLSLGAVILLAGPHNWMEARYFLTRMPARWGPLAPYFCLAIAGVVLLSAFSIAVPWLGAWAPRMWMCGLIAWVAGLVVLCRPTRLATGLMAGGAMVLVQTLPLPWTVMLVFAHPLLALWFLDHELRTRPAMRDVYRAMLVALPFLVGALWLLASPASTLDGAMLSRVEAAVGGGIHVHRMLAVYVFLQMLHYGVWIAALPALRLREAPWRVDAVPLAKRFPLVVKTALAVGAVAVVVLWLGFATATAIAWDAYFQLAIVHVLAEIPFLVRAR